MCKSGTCKNNGKCVPALGEQGFVCKCPAIFTGTFCEERVDRCYRSACRHDGKCINKAHNGFICKCTLGRSGKRCEKGI